MLKFWTTLANDLFNGTQIDLISKESGIPIQDTRFLLENEEEVLIAYGNEVAVVEVEKASVLTNNPR